MRRKLFSLCSAASLILCVAACAMWVVSYAYRLELQWARWDGGATPTKTRVIRGGSGSGSLFFSWGRIDWTDPVKAVSVKGEFERNYPRIVGPFGGHAKPYHTGAVRPGLTLFMWDAGVKPSPHGTQRTGHLLFPHWVAVVALACPPAAAAVARRRRRRRDAQSGLCVACGYDLRLQLALSEGRESDGRATPLRCPECGSTPGAAAA